MIKIARLKLGSLAHTMKTRRRDFTRWLAENIDHLNEIPGLTLTAVEREVSAGDLSVDIPHSLAPLSAGCRGCKHQS